MEWKVFYNSGVRVCSGDIALVVIELFRGVDLGDFGREEGRGLVLGFSLGVILGFGFCARLVLLGLCSVGLMR